MNLLSESEANIHKQYHNKKDSRLNLQDLGARGKTIHYNNDNENDDEYEDEDDF